MFAPCAPHSLRTRTCRPYFRLGQLRDDTTYRRNAINRDFNLEVNWNDINAADRHIVEKLKAGKTTNDVRVTNSQSSSRESSSR